MTGSPESFETRINRYAKWLIIACCVIGVLGVAWLAAGSPFNLDLLTGRSH